MIKAHKRHIIDLVGCFCQGFFQELDLGKYSSCSFVQHKLPKLFDLKMKRSFWAHKRHHLFSWVFLPRILSRIGFGRYSSCSSSAQATKTT